ncbi:MAG TPA: hypothetical protein VGD78_22845 [Chthoniobacterales bacterium]
MSIHPEGASRRRRTGEEVQQLVSEFGVSGLGVSEFCRRHGVATSTLRRHVKRPQGDPRESESGVRLMAVKVNGAPPVLNAAGAPALEVILAGGRRIGVGPAFDAPTLSRLVQVLEEG